VGAIEAKPAQGLISNESPVGRALLGLRPGEETVAVAPHGETRLRIVRIER
jgi:transcription elongation factor GreA